MPPASTRARFDDFGRVKKVEAFQGYAYCGENTATDDSVRRFTTTPVRLKDAVIQARGRAQLIGDSDLQDYLLKVGDTLKLSYIDASTLYVTNAIAGKNGRVVILGARD
ncbi:MAG: hypothetical protein R6V59_01665 [Dehalococcoidia bacterium]